MRRQGGVGRAWPGRARVVAAGLVLLASLGACAGVDRSVSAVGGSGPARAGAASTADLDTGISAQLLARVPRFPPAPPPEPMVVPAGPSAGWLSTVSTSQPVAFLTIDDGWIKDREAAQLIRAAHVPVTLFLTIDAIRDDPAYFVPLQRAGAAIEAHTITHQSLRGLPYGVQKREVCGSADQLAELYGRRPLLFRPPYGEIDSTTLRVVHDCGMLAALHWRESVINGAVRYQQADHTVQAGDIILLHFRATFVEDFLAALWAIHDAGLTPARLESYLVAGAEPSATPSPTTRPPA
jgi:peptidoglycan/xylan/chitin deacetylase (PgdA/CDA1 family)